MIASLTIDPRTSLEQEIAALPREQLVPLLYEHLLGHLQSARQKTEDGDSEGGAHHLERALAILFELIATLDVSRGGEIGPRLAALYSYFVSAITEIGRTRDVELLHRLSGMVSGLHESWRAAAAETAWHTA